MLVTGVTQMISAPLAVQLEKRTDERWLAGVAFAIFAVGLVDVFEFDDRNRL